MFNHRPVHSLCTLGKIAMLPALIACTPHEQASGTSAAPTVDAATSLPVTASTGAQENPAPDATRPAASVDPKVLTALDAMGKHIRSLEQFAIQADTTTDMVVEDGQKLTLGAKVDYKVVPPKGLFADVAYDRTRRQYYFDGNNLTIYAPSMKYYGQFSAPGTIGDLMDKADSVYGVDLPLADVFFWGTSHANNVPITSAVVVGPTKIGNNDVDHYAIRQGDVDWQVWIDQGTKPLPRKLVYTAHKDPARPQFTAELSWNTAPALDDASFRFTPPKGAHKINAVPGVRDVVDGTEQESTP